MKVHDFLPTLHFIRWVIPFIILAFLVYRPAATIAPKDTAVSAFPPQASKPEASVHSATGEPSSSADAPASTRLPGIDVSHYQGRVVWPSVKSAGVRYVYVKATDGITYTDPRYAENVAALQSLDVPYGAYHFFEPQDDPIAQAKHYLSKVDTTKASLPPVLDVEITRQLKPEQIRSRVKQWLDYVEKETGCRPMLYTYGAFWDENLGAEFSRYPLWLADYAATPTLPEGVEAWRFWQHSEKGQVNGIEPVVDLNWFAGDTKELGKLACKG